MPIAPFQLRIDEELELRQRMPEDAEELFALTDANRGYLRRWLPWLPMCRTAEDTRFNIEIAIRDAEDGVGLALLILEQGKIVGVTGFNTICKDNRTGQIGYWLGKQHQGRGIMTRAVRALVQYGFDTLNLNRVCISAATANLRSRAVAERLGFRFESVACEVEWVNGRSLDHAVYAMTRSQWDDANPPHMQLEGIRAMRTMNVSKAIELWHDTDGVGLSPEETPEMIAAFLDRNPGISSVAMSEVGELIGAVLGGQDGRRGYLYHLAVKASHRGQGIGRRLVDRTVAELARLGIARATIMVYVNNDEGRSFWEHLGWKVRADLNPLQIDL